MDIKLSNATSPPPTNPELLVKSPTYSRSKEIRREETSDLNHETHLRNISHKAELDLQRGQTNVERNLEKMEKEKELKNQDFEYDLERGQELHEKHIEEIRQKGKEDVDHSFKVVENLKQHQQQQQQQQQHPQQQQQQHEGK